MKENLMICNCKKVSLFDIVEALHKNDKFENVLEAFESVKKVTHCSTGCGGCHDKVLAVISDILMGYENV